MSSSSSSSQDEIMEISNLSSSLDNHFLEPFEPSPVDNAISVLSNSNSLVVKRSSSSSKANKRYSSKFKKEWLSNSYFSTFLRECKTDRTKALCITCNLQFLFKTADLVISIIIFEPKSIKNVQNPLKLTHVRLTTIDFTAKRFFLYFLSKNN
jgi:hypothetical protein